MQSREALIEQSAYLDRGAVIAADVSIGPYCVISDGVSLERLVQVNAGVVFSECDAKRTLVREGSVIGAGSVIGPGLELGIGCQVLPGSVVLDSVPSHAIVQGNPAQIVGYSGLSEVTRVDVERGEFAPASPISEPRVIQLNVGASTLHRMKRVVDLRGSLTVGEFESEVPFLPRRYFIVFDVPLQELRGAHAHKKCHQFLVCVRGSLRILLDDGSVRREVVLDRPDTGVYMPPMIWGTQYRYTSDAVLLVFASHAYDPEDYIRTYDDFLRQLKLVKA